jgi:hypothetical protein
MPGRPPCRACTFLPGWLSNHIARSARRRETAGTTLAATAEDGDQSDTLDPDQLVRLQPYASGSRRPRHSLHLSLRLGAVAVGSRTRELSGRAGGNGWPGFSLVGFCGQVAFVASGSQGSRLARVLRAIQDHRTLVRSAAERSIATHLAARPFRLSPGDCGEAALAAR